MYRIPYTGYKRFPCKEVKIGSIGIGGKNPVRVQTMTNTNTLDIKATAEQIIRIKEAGSEIVRISTPGINEARALPGIKKLLKQTSIEIPVVADVHFSPAVAEMAARYVEKIRINPGNYSDISKSSRKVEFSEAGFNTEKEITRGRLTPLLKICKQYGTALRIGINHGSLSWRIVNRYGNTPEGMVESALEFIEICREENFHNIVLSLKASNPLTMIHANRLMAEKMYHKELYYPIHLGVTEAGYGHNGIIKSALATGLLLTEGIGDTIRVSLTCPPEHEIPVAKAITENAERLISASSDSLLSYNWPYNPFTFHRRITNKTENIGGGNKPVIIYTGYSKLELSPPDISDSGGFKPEQLNIVEWEGHFSAIRKKIFELYSSDNNLPVILNYGLNNESESNFLYNFSIVAGSLLADGVLDGIMISNVPEKNEEDVIKTVFSTLQASRSRITTNELVSCPSCGRTKFDIEKAVEDVDKATKEFKGLKIAVMGCVVNGPGEMADADYGYVGAGENKVNIYRKNNIVKTGVPENEALTLLIELIRSDNK